MSFKASFSFIYGFLPVITIFSNKFIPKGFGGYNYGFINIIRPKYKDDKGLINHEIQHSKQFYRTFGLAPIFRSLGIFPFLKKFSDRKIFNYECEAYGKQLCFIDSESFNWALKLFSQFVVTKYGIVGYSIEEAKEEIFKHYERFKRKDG
ncbi:hypothetical protein SAMN06269117_11441 [Balnearium lithotrophicum]|uniref:Uncharacterized protein n=1 Tax=Balnearium lithotrophicum TaxID=223788 RepID=A0A521CPL8_9BACT|nr:hypothetical protein [Balnearium lithotrophicum]SMO61414.1 hypothetical protein SAMN06269117_11441 [Balnearium lithotrophicum]